MELREDIERLANIGEQVLAGKPLESFDLTDYERNFVLGYTRQGVEEELGPVPEFGVMP